MIVDLPLWLRLLLVIASTGITALLVFSACHIIARLCLPPDPPGELTARRVGGPGADFTALRAASLPQSPAAGHIASAEVATARASAPAGS